MITLRHLFGFVVAMLIGSGVALQAADPVPPDHGPAPTLKTAGNEPIAPKTDGFLSRWWLLDPIPGDGRVVDSAIQAAARKEYFPGQLTVVPRNGDKVVSGGTEYAWHALDSNKHNVNLYHFAFFNHKPTTNQVFWAVTIVHCPQDIANVRLAVGSNAGSVWWVNGQEVIGIYGDRQTTIDDGVSKKLTLRKGPNVIRGLIVNNGGMVDFCARFLDKDDTPLTTYTVSLNADPK